MQFPSAQGNKVSLHWREHGYLLRSLTPSDACQKYLDWIASPDLMGALNMPARKMSLAELRTSISGFDQRSNLLCGIFKDGPPQELIGIFVFTLNLDHRILRPSGFVAEKGPLPKLFDFAKGFMRHLFEQKGVEKIGAQVALANKGAIAAAWAMGFRLEGELKGEIRKFDGSSRIDQLAYGLLREDWRKRTTPKT